MWSLWAPSATIWPRRAGSLPGSRATTLRAGAAIGASAKAIEPVAVPPRSRPSAIRVLTYMNAGSDGALLLASCAPGSLSWSRSAGPMASSVATAIPAAVLNRSVMTARFTEPAGVPSVCGATRTTTSLPAAWSREIDGRALSPTTPASTTCAPSIGRAPSPWSRGMKSVHGEKAAPPAVTPASGARILCTSGTVWKKPPSSPAGSSPIRRASAAR